MEVPSKKWMVLKPPTLTAHNLVLKLTQIFFPENALESRRVHKVVTEICSSCHFREPCLEYSLNNVLHGTWAGFTEFQRNKMGGKKRHYPNKKAPRYEGLLCIRY